MLSRAGAAILALTAVVWILFSVVLSAWWDGHPSFGGNEQRRFVIHIGLLGGEGCKVGSDDGRDICEPLDLGGGFTATSYIELAATGVIVFGAIALALFSLNGRALRRTFAKIVMTAAGAAAIVGIALLIQGPDVRTAANYDITLPHNILALAFYAAGLVSAVVAGIIALQRPGALKPRTARPVWATSATAPPAGAGQPPAVDVLALLQEDQLRPAQLGPEPMIGRPSHPDLALANTERAPARPSPSPPLFQGAPQLKPLYEVPGAAFVPPAPPPLPSRGPTPMPRAAVSAAAGIPTPPAFDGARPKTLPPPIRGKPVTAPPLSRPPVNAAIGLAQTEPQMKAMRASPPLGERAMPPMSDKTIGPVVVPPPAPPPASALAASGSPPSRPSKPPPLPVPLVPQPPQLPPQIPPIHLESESFLADNVTVERRKHDAGKATFTTEKPTAARSPAALDSSLPTARSSRRHVSAFENQPTNALPTGFNISTPSGEAGEDTDVAVVPAIPSGNESFSNEFPTSIDPDAIASVEERVASRRSDQIAASTDQDLPVVGSKDAGDSDEVDPHAETVGPVPVAQVAALLSGPKPRASQPSVNVKLPISTAPESLPPPTAKQTATMGPTPACPQCESPMAWVEEHLRFYCKSCKMYF